MGFHDYLRFALALAFVLALMGIVAQLAKRSAWGKLSMPGGRAARRLAVLESRPLDARHKLMLVQCDDREHLLVLGPEGQTVIESTAVKKDAS